MRLEIEVYGEKQFARELIRFRDRSQDMRPAFEAIHKSFLAIERHQFTSQGGFSGGWAPLAASTIAFKARMGYDPRILHRTLRLRRSLTSASHDDHIFEMSPDELVMGSRVPYGVFHQTGTRNMPRRRPIELTDKHRNRWVKILQRWLVEGRVTP